jgi:hypothetical protein
VAEADLADSAAAAEVSAVAAQAEAGEKRYHLPEIFLFYDFLILN